MEEGEGIDLNFRHNCKEYEMNRTPLSRDELLEKINQAIAKAHGAGVYGVDFELVEDAPDWWLNPRPPASLREVIRALQKQYRLKT